MAPLISFLLIIGLSLVVTRVATVALTLTGLSRESARFQARSAFTGVGFTTTESEKAVRHPVRRRVLMILMLLGNAGVVGAVASLMLALIKSNEEGQSALVIGVMLAGLALIWWMAESQWVEKHMNRIIGRILERTTDLDVRDYSNLLALSRGYGVNEVEVSEGEWLQDKRLDELNLRQEGVTVLGIQREAGGYVGAPKGKTQIRAGDTLLLYGKSKLLRELDFRGPGLQGAAAHRQAVEQQKKEEKNHKSEDIPEKN